MDNSDKPVTRAELDKLQADISAFRTELAAFRDEFSTFSSTALAGIDKNHNHVCFGVRYIAYLLTRSAYSAADTVSEFESEAVHFDTEIEALVHDDDREVVTGHCIMDELPPNHPRPQRRRGR